MNCTIRSAVRGDALVLFELVKGLAEFERDLQAVEITPEKLAADIFDANLCEAIVAEQNGQVVGMAFFFQTYSTWNGPCMNLLDLYVISEARGMGVGGKLFDRVVEIAKERNYKRMDWQVLDWNESAIEFYKKRGARIDEDWLNGRLFFGS